MVNPMPRNPQGSQIGRQSNLGQVLIEVGIISQEQLNQALAAANGVERDLAKWLIDLGFTTEEKIMKGIGIKAKVPYFTSLEGLYTAESANIISEELARRLQVVPLFKIDNAVTVAMLNPLDVFIIDALTKMTGFRIDPVVCMRSTIFETINKIYAGWEGGDQPIQQEVPPPISAMAPPPFPAAPPPPQMVVESSKIAVSNGIETVFIDPADEADAMKDGYRRI